MTIETSSDPGVKGTGGVSDDGRPAPNGQPATDPNPDGLAADPDPDGAAAEADRKVYREVYAVINGGFARAVKFRGDDGLTRHDLILRYEQLSNFTARIVEEVVLDDGQSTTRRFLVEGETADGHPLRAEVAAAEFEAMRWLKPAFGAGAWVAASRGAREHLRNAIEQHSAGVRKRTIYTHTGWTGHNGRWSYLHTGGAIGAGGNDPSVSVKLPGSLAGYSLHDPPEGEDLVKAVRAVLRLSQVAQPGRPNSETLAAVLLSLAFRAALGASRFSVHMVGSTGAYKTSSAGLVVQHFGAELNPRRGLTAVWDSTPGALEVDMCTIKDALLLIDDFVPDGPPRESADLHRVAGRVFRSQGNLRSRQWLNPDGTRQTERPPRGTVISTGEDQVAGRSADARTLPVRFVRADPARGVLGTVDPDVLTACQADADAGLYARAMAAFVKWVASRYDEVQSTLKGLADQFRREFTRPGDHGRTPEIAADLLAGFEVFLLFAREAGAVDADEVARYRDLVRTGLAGAAEEVRTDRAEEFDVGDLFIGLLKDALAAKRAYVTNLAGGTPADKADAYGWKLEWRYQGALEGQQPCWVIPANTKQAGWTDGEYLYLNPGEAYRVVQHTAEHERGSLPTRYVVWKTLHETGRIVLVDTRNRIDGRGRFTCRKQIGGQQQTVLMLRCSDVWGEGEDEPPVEPRQAELNLEEGVIGGTPD
jgi:hypothetical protein